jgi:hypothetical protein
MSRALLIAMAFLMAFGGTADARCKNKGCRKMRGHHVTVRAVVPMVAASLEAAGVPTPDPNSAPSPAITTPDPPTALTPARLGVVAREWSLVLSRSTLPAGPAVVQLQNFGEDAHNLRIERLDGASGFDVPLAEAGEVQKGQGTLAAGDYKIYCALPGHEAQGMRARFTVVQ